jgi:hypothetical protein
MAHLEVELTGGHDRLPEPKKRLNEKLRAVSLDPGGPPPGHRPGSGL